MDLTTFKALTFDCYGTLIDWEAGIVSAVIPILRARGVRAGEDEVLSVYGELEASAERAEYRPYRQVLISVMHGIGTHYGLEFSRDEREALVRSVGEARQVAPQVSISSLR